MGICLNHFLTIYLMNYIQFYVRDFLILLQNTVDFTIGVCILGAA